MSGEAAAVVGNGAFVASIRADARKAGISARTLDAAFAGVFGAGPADLYGAFTVDLTERALHRFKGR